MNETETMAEWRSTDNQLHTADEVSTSGLVLEAEQRQLLTALPRMPS